MLFDDRKPEPSQLVEMLSCSIDSIEPYSLLLAPAYIYMKRNDRVVSVKAPLDFFTPEELEKIRRYDLVYFPKFVKSAVQFETAARLIRKMILPVEGRAPRASYELMREVSLAASELWFSDLRIEPFFAAVFCQELCAPLSRERIVWAREEAVVRHERGLLLSGLFVFVAIQLGWINLPELSRCRNEIYERTVRGEEWVSPQSEMDSIVIDLQRCMDQKPGLSLTDLLTIDAEWARLLAARVKGWSKKLEAKAKKSPSIYGPEGLIA